MNLAELVGRVYNSPEADPGEPDPLESITRRVYGPRIAPEEGQAPTLPGPSRVAPGGPQLTVGRVEIPPEPSIGERVVNAIGKFFRGEYAPQPPQTDLEMSPRDLAGPAAMTLTRGGQPVLQTTPAAPPPEPPTKLWSDVAKALPGQFGAGTVGAANAIQGMMNPPLTEEQLQLERDAAGSPAAAEIARQRAAREETVRRARDLAQATADLYPNALPMSEPQQAVTSAVSSAAPTMIGMGAGLINPAVGAGLGAGLGGLSQAAQSYEEVIRKTNDPAMATRVAIVDGIAEVVGEKIGLDALLRQGGRGVVAKVLNGLRGAGVEASEELVTQIVQSVNAKLNHEPDKTLDEILSEARVAFMAGGVGGTAFAGVSNVTQALNERFAGQDTGATGEVSSVPRGTSDLEDAVRRVYGETSGVPQGTSEDVVLNQLGDTGRLTKGTKERVELQPDLEGGPSPFPVSEQAARERLDRTLSREPEVGAPSNPRTILRDDQGEFAVGRIDPDDWMKRVKSSLTIDELAEARTWYSQLHDTLTPLYGEEAPRYALAWLLSQQQESPSGGMRNVLRASDLARGMPQIKRAGLNQDNLVKALKGETPEGGIGAKLLDFIDSELGTKTRTVMGRDARGGQPAAIDVWAARDMGRVDSATLAYVRKRFGEQAAKRLRQEPDSLGESQYEYGSRFYNDMVERLNRVRFNGGGWTAREAQAVGWVSMQKALGAQPEFVKDIIGKNTRRVSLGLSTGAGAPRSEGFTEEEAAGRIGRIANLTGVKLLKTQAGEGAYLKDTERAYQLDAFASPESVRDFMDALGFAFQQTSIIATRALKSGKSMAIDVEGGFNGRENEFFQKLLEYTDLTPGYQQTERGLRFLNFGGRWSQKDQGKIQDALNQAAQDLGIELRDIVAFNVELQETQNDWTQQKAGEAYLASLRDRGRLQVASELERQFGQQEKPAEDVTLGQEPGPVFYSELARQVAKGPNKASAQQWRGYIKGLQGKGVKAEEVEFSGILDYIEMVEDNPSISKDELVSWLYDNGVMVGEKVLGEAPLPPGFTSGYRNGIYSIAWSENPRYRHESGDLSTAALALQIGLEDAAKRLQRADAKAAEPYFRAAEALTEYVEALEGNGPAGTTQYNNYTLPGKKNGYRELLITLPFKQDGNDAVAKKLFGKTYADLNNAQRGFVQRNIFQAEGQPNFTGPHFDEPNILAHVRFDERADADGKRVLFIEEIQSDWAQKGKREGFGSVEEGKRFHVTDMSTGQRSAVSVTREEAERILAEERKTFPDRVFSIVPANSVGGLLGAPRAPFVTKTESWTALALKRMIRYAAEHGFDKVAWTTGKQQSDRYNLAKQVERISYYKQPKGTSISVYTEARTNRAALELVIGPDNKVADGPSQLVGKPALDVLGKEILDKIEQGIGHEVGAPEGSGELKGVNLEVGGEGMKAYYDRIVPNVANDVLKKLGGPKVTSVQVFDATGSGIYKWQIRRPDGSLLNDGGATRYYDDRDAATILSKRPEMRKEPRPQPQQQGFEITPELRAKVIGEGIPLFQKTSLEKQQGLPIVGGTRKGYFNQSYKHSQPVKVTWENGDVIYDAVKGLNEGHALWRARDNWPGAKVEAVSLEEVKKNDPESYREITRLQTYGIAALPPSRVEMYSRLHDPVMRQEGAPAAKIKTADDFGRTFFKPTRGQTAVLERAAGKLVRAGIAPAIVREVEMGAHKGESPALYNVTLHRISFMEQMLNAAMAGEPGMDQWLPNAMAHEISHALDRGTSLAFGAIVSPDVIRSMASARSPRFDFTANADYALTDGGIVAVDENAMRPEGDLIKEAWDAFWNGPEPIRQFLQYPFLKFGLEQDATIKTEVFAQLSSLYATSKVLMREHLPLAFEAFEEIYGKTTFSAAAQQVPKTLRSRTDISSGPKIEPGAGRTSRGREADGGRPPSGPTGTSLGQSPGGRGSGPALGVFDVADPTRWDEFVRRIQDNRVDLKRLQEAILKSKAIPESQDAYLKDEQRIARTADKIDRARKEDFVPLIRAIRDAKLTLDEVESFLHARHAPEANAQIAKARRAAGQPATPGLAGMTNVEARKVIDDFRQAGKLAALRTIADKVDAIIEKTRRIYVAGGLESQDTIDLWKSTYQYYVPLHREGFGDLNPATGKGYTVRGSETKRRVGSKLAVENILANIMAAHEAAIVRAEKNRVDRALWALLEANPNPEFWKKGTPAIRETIDVDTGLPTRVPDMAYKNQSNALVLKIDGKEKVILFNDRNARAMELAKSLKNMQGEDLSWWVRSWGLANRVLANLATSYNPVFWTTNLVRDLGTVAFNLQSTPLKGQEAKIMASIPSALLGVRDEIRGDGKSAWAGYYREAKSSGGMTGWMSSFDSINERADEIAKLLKKAERSKYDVREMGAAMLQVIKDYNDVIEHATRTAVYKAARDMGLSKDQSASIAKNITVNFNRKGTSSPHIGALYMFFNANVQGTARMASGMMKSKRVWAYMALAAGFGTALDLLNRLVLSDDDDDGENQYDKIPEDVKARALIVMVGKDGNYVKIPLPYGFNFPFAFGRVMAEFATKRDYTPWQAAMALAKVAVEAWSPFGQAATPAQVLAPSLVDPVIYTMENKDWAGRPIYQKDRERGPEMPASERGLRTTPLWAKSLAREIADASDGRIEINPGIVASLVTSYTSGLGTTLSQTFDLAHRAATGQEIPLAAVPLASRFAGEQTEGMRSRRFNELKEQAIEFDRRLQRLRKEGKADEARALEDEKPHLKAFMQAYKSEIRGKTLTNLYKEAEDLELQDLSRKERNEATKEWEARRGEVYSRILRKTNQARP